MTLPNSRDFENSLRKGYDPYNSAMRGLIPSMALARRQGFKILGFDSRDWSSYRVAERALTSREIDLVAQFDKINSAE